MTRSAGVGLFWFATATSAETMAGTFWQIRRLGGRSPSRMLPRVALVRQARLAAAHFCVCLLLGRTPPISELLQWTSEPVLARAWRYANVE